VASWSVVALHLNPAVGALEAVECLDAVGGKGFLGDRCFGKRHRQALLVSTRWLDEFGYQPGTLREQITIDMPELQDLPVGTRLQVGDVELMIEQDCEPCTKMATRLGEDPANFKAKTSLKRGMLAKVKTDGRIKVGDEVQIIRG
jgi:MOSC domain-containing protein YiiM